MARRLDEAAAEYREALRIDPSYANAHNNLGNVFLAQQKYDDAIREFEDVTRLQPTSIAGFRNLAAAYAAAGPSTAPSARPDAALLLAPAEPLATEIRRQRDQVLQRKRLELL